jgi:hypothetical protein
MKSEIRTPKDIRIPKTEISADGLALRFAFHRKQFHYSSCDQRDALYLQISGPLPISDFIFLHCEDFELDCENHPGSAASRRCRTTLPGNFHYGRY